MGIGFAGKAVFLVSLALCFSLIAAPADPAEEEARRSWITRAVSVPASQVIDRDFFAFGPLVEISGTVNGDVYVFGGQILVDGTVNGDLLVAGGRVSLSGAVAQDVRVVGGQVSVSGSIGRNVTAFGGNLEMTRSAAVKGSLVAAGGSIHLAAPLGGSAKIAAGSLIVSNKVGGNIDAAVGTLRITSNAEVAGNVSYLSRNEASIGEGAKIGGKLARTAPPQLPRPSPEKVVALYAAGSLFVRLVSFVSTLVLGLLSIRFLPRYHLSSVALLRERPWASLAIGFIAAVVIPVVCGLLFVSVLGIPIGLIVGASYLILLYWGRIFAISWLGEAILRLFRAGPGSTWAFVIGLIVYYLLTLIPVVGWLIVWLAVLFGLGAELMVRKNIYFAARQHELI
jgi:cytoskeletal protein CcmA (bactofilin family)